VFSIAVCTYNRAEQLSVLMKQFLQMQSWLYKYVELIVVDNNSSDSTLKMLDDYKENLPLKVFTEKEQGLAAARNRAINEYQGDRAMHYCFLMMM